MGGKKKIFPPPFPSKLAWLQSGGQSGSFLSFLSHLQKPPSCPQLYLSWFLERLTRTWGRPLGEAGGDMDSVPISATDLLPGLWQLTSPFRAPISSPSSVHLVSPELSEAGTVRTHHGSAVEPRSSQFLLPLLYRSVSLRVKEASPDTG